MDEMTRFRISGPIGESRLAFLLFLPAGLFFGGMLVYQPPEESWLKHAVMSVLIFFSLVRYGLPLAHGDCRSLKLTGAVGIVASKKVRFSSAAGGIIYFRK